MSKNKIFDDLKGIAKDCVVKANDKILKFDKAGLNETQSKWLTEKSEKLIKTLKENDFDFTEDIEYFSDLFKPRDNK